MTTPNRSVRAARRHEGRTPNGDAADRWLRESTADVVDRWLRGRGAGTPLAGHAGEAAPTPRQLQALREAPRLVSDVGPSAPAEDRWRRFLMLPEDARRARLGGRAPQGLTLALPDRAGVPVRCLYRLVVIDEEVVLLPAIVRVGELQFRAFGGREDYAPGSVPPAYRPAYEAVWATLRGLQAEFDRARGGDDADTGAARDR